VAKVMRLDVRAYAGDDDDDDDGSSAADDAAAPPALGCLRNALVGEDIDMVLLLSFFYQLTII
jgi:hypothetical protein